ncbi:hypothetical protein QR721_10050 [Aciduricibacillus chroicocephali]|uniref:Uncharacterized protein n=1 Tax=Aciduricibacillus chroicocephali TaxID=3054939 RepID=A0ABY9KUP7_9BACI|nr:hypothetical protein QR721_10050 [Bacillaceae bacterium 44XB]
MQNKKKCICSELEQKISQHEEVITQLLHMLASLNKAVSDLAAKQQIARHAGHPPVPTPAH